MGVIGALSHNLLILAKKVEATRFVNVSKEVPGAIVWYIVLLKPRRKLLLVRTSLAMTLFIAILVLEILLIAYPIIGLKLSI